MVDQAQFHGALCQDEAARGQHLEGLLARDVAAEGHHGGRTEQTDVDAVHAEARVIGGHGHVAAGHQLASRRRGNAVHFGNHRLRQARDHLHDGGAAIEEIAQRGGPLVGRIALGLHFLEVMPGTKRLTSAAQDHDFLGVVVHQAGEFRVQPRQHGIRQCIERAGHVQRQPRDRAQVLSDENFL